MKIKVLNLFLTSCMSKNLHKFINKGRETTECQGLFRGTYSTPFRKNKLYVFFHSTKAAKGHQIQPKYSNRGSARPLRSLCQAGQVSPAETLPSRDSS